MKKRLTKAVTALTLGGLLALSPVGCIKNQENDVKPGYTQLTSFEKHGFFEIDSFSLSPDKKRIAFSAEKYDSRLNWRDESEIYVIDVDGSNLVKLTDNKEQDYNPVWSKDGKKIFFESLYNTRKLEAINVEDKSLEEVINVENHESIGSMSPDENFLLFYKRNEQIKEHPFELHKLDIKSGTTEKIAEGVDDAEWLPDGKKLVYIRHADKKTKLCTLDLTNKEEIILREEAIFSSPKWSPDGKKIAYFAYSPYDHSNFLMMLEFVDKKKDRAFDKALRSYDGTGLEERLLRWSSDSKKLLFATFTKNSQEIYTYIDVNMYNSGHPLGFCVQLTYSLGNESSPDWLNDEEIITLYFDPEKFEGSQIYKINPEETAKDERSIFDILEPGISSSDIECIIEKISPAGFKSYKNIIEILRREELGKLLYESLTLAEDGEKMILHRILKDDKKDVYCAEYCIFERCEDSELKPRSLGAYTFTLKDDDYSSGRNEYYVNGKADKKILSDFFKMEKKDKGWEIKGYGRGGTTYYKMYS